MRLYLADPEGPPQVKCNIKSLDDENLDCSLSYTLGHTSINRRIGRRNHEWYIDDRPVPSVPFHYYLDTNLKANPIPGLCGDFVISFGSFRRDRPSGGSKEFSLQLPKNSFIAIDDELMDWVKDWRAQYLVYYLRSEKKLVYEHRAGDLTDASYTVKIHVPEGKRILGTTGNRQLLLDPKHDDRPAVNFGSEYLGFTSRPLDDYTFTGNFADANPQPKQLVI